MILSYPSLWFILYVVSRYSTTSSYVSLRKNDNNLIKLPDLYSSSYAPLSDQVPAGYPRMALSGQKTKGIYRTETATLQLAYPATTLLDAIRTPLAPILRLHLRRDLLFLTLARSTSLLLTITFNLLQDYYI